MAMFVCSHSEIMLKPISCDFNASVETNPKKQEVYVWKMSK